MKILNKEQIYEADKQTVTKQGITSYQLMERAGGLVFQWLHHRLKGCGAPIKIFCGIGNNGGDGLVIARELLEQGYTVTIYVVNYSDHRSEDFLKAEKALNEQAETTPAVLKTQKDFPSIEATDFIIDAVFGIGYNRPAPGWVQKLLKQINDSGAYILSIDVPSGLYLDQVPAKDEAVIKPKVLLSFQVPKMVFFFPQTGKYIKDWEILDIGLDKEYLKEVETNTHLIDTPEAVKLYKPRERFTHKGTFGHSLIIGGSYGKMGAALLSAKACLKSGSGLVSAYVPKFAMPIMQTALPEVMVLTDRHDGRYFEEIVFDLDPDVIGIGMGLGTEKITVDALYLFLKNNKKSLVIDADALNIIAKNKKFLELLPAKTILTPHPKELQRLIGAWKDDFEKMQKVTVFAKKHDLIIVVKGANTMTVYDGQIYVNNTGNPGMATGGTGDVLTGVITALIAQSYDSVNAAILGVYLHGRAGDLAAEKVGYEALISEDVVNYLGAAFMEIYEHLNT